MVIRPYRADDLAPLEQIVHKLHPKWFDANALINIPIDIQLGNSFVAEDSNEVKGFIVISSLEGVVWINWLAVDPQYHGKSIGTELLKHVEEKLKQLGVHELRVDTVVEQSPPDGTYDKTIQFYLKHGFRLIEKKEQKKYKDFK